MKTFISSILFSEVGPLVRLGRRRTLQADDMPQIDNDLRAHDVEQAFANINTSNSLRFIWEAFKACGQSARRVMIINCARVPLALTTPLLMRNLLHNLSSIATVQQEFWSTTAMAAGISLLVMTEAIVIQHVYYNSLKTWSRIANGLNMRVYRHSLVITREAQQSTQSGDMVNHMASDSEGMAEAGFFIPEIASSALLLLGAIAMLFALMGPSAIASLLTLLVMFPLTRAAAKRFAHYDTELWKHRDDRVTLMSQILAGIRIVKYFAWERSMTREVDELRAKEIDAYIKLVRAEALGVMLFLSTSTFVAFSGFSCYVLLGGQLTAAFIFPCLLLFMLLETPIGMLPHFIKNLAHARVAADRLHRFFGLATHEHTQTEETAPDKALALRIENLSVVYHNASVQRSHEELPEHASSAPAEQEHASLNGSAALSDTTAAAPMLRRVEALHNINLQVAAGESIALVGAVGSGKSSILLALLGEVDAESGSVHIEHCDSTTAARCAYVPQEAYILNATIRENILFGSDSTSVEADIERALQLCALDTDLAQLSAGLDTEIGERGVNLSGGQKMRIALARAVLRRPGLLLLDDPLAAVDIHTEEVLVDRLICGAWEHRTRIVCTHRLAHLHRFDRVVFVHEGRIEVDAPLNEALERSDRFRAFYAEHLHADEEAAGFLLNKNQQAQQSTHAHDGSLVDEEDRATGAITMDLFMGYLRQLAGANGQRRGLSYAVLTLSCLLVVILPISQGAWLAWWTDMAGQNAFFWSWISEPLHAIAVYGVIGLTVLMANFGERLVWVMKATYAGRDIHNQTLAAVLAAPLRFFDTTPMGRILNRFAHDMAGVDDELSWNFESTFRSLAQMLGTLALILVTAPLVIIAAVPALLMFYRVQNDYRLCAREAKRLSSIARSPRYAHYKETISGLPVIRAFGQQEQFTRLFVQKLEFFQRMNWGSIMLNRWFSTRAPLLSGVIALTTTTVTVWMCATGHLRAGLAGVVMTYSLNFWAYLNWCVRSFSEVESRMTSYERLRAYSQLEPEAQTTSTPVLSDTQEWPLAGTLEFHKLSARYAEGLPLVLRSLNFRIDAGMRVGIVGRTGSGKTSIFQTLFRFIPAAEGSITIDGVDIASIPLHRLRRAMAVIPQDPMLFIGSVRSNLDRFSEYGDDAVWSALQRVRMADTIRELGGLQAAVTESGQNFSQGQRQLLCLARAILTNARIIVMDEATASVDVQTDALIQHTIREEFAGVTVIIIAHRLNSVSDADMIIEMHHGEARIHRNATEIAEDEFE